MKRSILSILFAAGLATLAAAQTQTQTQTQTPDTTLPGPKRPATERAVHQLKTMEKQLQLSQDQVLQLQVILIHKDIAMDSIRNNSSGNRKADARARHFVQHDADTKIYAMLTDEQRPLYQQWKEQHQSAARNHSGPPH